MHIIYGVDIVRAMSILPFACADVGSVLRAFYSKYDDDRYFIFVITRVCFSHLYCEDEPFSGSKKGNVFRCRFVFQFYNYWIRCLLIVKGYLYRYFFFKTTVLTYHQHKWLCLRKYSMRWNMPEIHFFFSFPNIYFSSSTQSEIER